MSNFTWTEDKIRNLRRSHLERVESNMRKYPQPSVRFGTSPNTKGKNPNYEIISRKDSLISRFPYSAKKKEHELDPNRNDYKDETYNNDYLSEEEFSLEKIQQILRSRS